MALHPQEELAAPPSANPLPYLYWEGGFSTTLRLGSLLHGEGILANSSSLRRLKLILASTPPASSN